MSQNKTWFQSFIIELQPHSNPNTLCMKSFNICEWEFPFHKIGDESERKAYYYPPEYRVVRWQTVVKVVG